MSTTYRRRRLSEPEREQRRKAERERVKEAVEQLLTSEGWQRWVRARSMFRHYSAHNTMLLALDFHLRGIEPEPVAGFRVWLKLGRCVRKGEHGIRISARVTPKKAERDAEQIELKLDKRPVRFTTVSVFDRLSRVRSGDLVDARPGRYVACRSPGLCCSSARQPHGGGMDMACAVVAEPASIGRRRSGDRARVSPTRPREQKRDNHSAEECRHRVPGTGNLADRRRVAEGCRHAPIRATSAARISWPPLFECGSVTAGGAVSACACHIRARG